MIWSYTKIAFRNLVRYSSFSLINILGLSIGLSASLLIALWVFDELSYDKFHDNSEQIYRVERHINFDGKIFDVPVTGAIYAPTIKKDVPEVLEFTRVYPIELSVQNHMNDNQEERVMFCDKGFFNVFTFPLERGNPETALAEPFSVVLTKQAALAYFGEEYPMDKSLEIEWGDERKKFRVTGILADIPTQNHFQFDVLGSFETIEELMPERLDTWVSNYLYSYVLLHKDATYVDAKPKLMKIVEDHISPAYTAFLGDDAKIENIHDIYQITFRPIENIHLDSNLMWDIAPQGNMTSVYTFCIVSILILVMACFNFMNLSTALGSKRSREVGIRKTSGASRIQLIAQFLGETTVIALISLIVALIIIEITLPGFNAFTDKNLTLSSFLIPSYFFVLVGIVFGSGVLAGLYPAFFLSKYDPMVVLHKNDEARGTKFSFRQLLVIFQFSISIMLIIGTIVAYLQINFFYNKPLGYSQENLLVISNESNKVRENIKTFKASLYQNPEVKMITTSGSIPAAINFSDMGFKTEEMDDVISSIYIGVGYDFFKTYDIELLAGRAFSPEYGMDTTNKYIVNEQVLKKVGIATPEEAIGKHYGSFDRNSQYQPGEIIGVVKDFHFKPLDKEIEPVTFNLNEEWMEYITIRYETNNLPFFINEIESLWKDHFPHEGYTYFTVKDRYESLYINETRLKSILLFFTFLAIFIGCLGLFGLAAFVAQQKSKEIGIRKVHGAPVSSIVLLLTKQFTYWVLLANIIAWPLSYFFLDNWLANFHYRINMPYWVFFVSGLLALILAILTVSYRAYRSATSNPLDAIKDE
ncbi:MAG: ABC transporter permease [Bacteroidetes bacterium]|nr:ABC transporter permease [Bacteroidota bacterium]